jgi:putative hydroxymethylpyrimidine transport system substrate-binding protein
LLALLACLAATGCGTRDETTTPKETASLKVLVDGGDQPITAAQRAGLFKAAGIDAQVTAGSGIDANAAAVAHGDADLALSSAAGLLLARDRGLHVVSIAALVNGPQTVVVSKGPLRGPADLKGKSVATEGNPFERAMVATIQARAGGPVKAVGAGKKADARIQFSTERRGKKEHAVPITRFGVPPFYGLVLVTSEERLDSDADVLRSFTGALGHAVKDSRNPAFAPTPGKPYGWQVKARWQPFAEWMSGKGLLQHDPDVPAAFTNDVLPGQRL